MKHLCFVLFGVIYSVEGALWMADVYNLARQCNKLPEVNGTEDDVNDILMGYLPETRSGMCMLRCMEIHAGILVNDEYDVKGAYTFFRKHFPENPYCKNMERGVRFCEKLILKRKKPNTDSCQHAHMVAACIKRRIKYVPGTRAAFYRPFVWKNPSKKNSLKPVKKYFEVEQRHKQPKIIYEIITKPTRKYSLDDLKVPLLSGESLDTDAAHVWFPPRPRKGKWKATDRRKNKKKEDSEEDSEEEDWDKSSKTRRHQKKMFRI